MSIDDFMLDTRYNRKGPETCLTDEDFIYLWNYFKINLLPNFSYAYVLKNVLGLNSEWRLPAMAIFTNKEAVFDYLNNGDFVMMAGDRISATNPEKTIPVKILDQNCELPMGVFRFAKSMSHPIFATALLNTGHEKYELIVKKLDNQNANNMATEFSEFLEQNILIAPTQWFNFYDFFKSDK